MMIKKYIFLFLLLPIFLLVKAQNTAIKDASGALLPATKEFCPGDVFNLRVDAAATSTGDYAVSNFTGTLPVSGFNISFPNHSGDNHFSAPISIPFPFQYYGVTYTKLVVGYNGRIILGNGTELDNFSTILDNVGNQQIPNAAYQIGTNTAEIFFGYTQHTYQPNDYQNIFQTSTTINGKNAFGITINGVNPTGYSRKSYQSVYLLSDNSIVIKYIEMDGSGNGSFPSGPIQQRTILGLQNQDAGKGKWPSEAPKDINANDQSSPYRYGRWQNTPQAYLFTPDLNLTPKIDWLLNGSTVNANAQPNNTFPNYTPYDGDTLEADISYLQVPTEVTKSFVKFNTYKKPSISVAPGTCNSTKLAVTNPQPGYTYSWKSGDPAFIATGTSITVGNTGNYYAVPNGCDAQKSDPVAVTISSGIAQPKFDDGANFSYCDNLGKISAPINLLQLVKYTPDANSTMIFTDAAGNTVADAANNFTVNFNSGTTQNFVMNVTSTAVNCPISRKISVGYLSFPAAQFPLTTPKLCFGTSSYSIANFKNDFPQYAGFDLSFSTDNVNFNANAVNPGQMNPIYVKLSKSGFDCTSVATLNFDFYDEILIKSITPFPDHCTSNSEYFDLNITKRELEYSQNITVTFYSDQAFTKVITNLHYRGSGTIYTKISDGTCSIDGPQFQLNVYQPPRLTKNGPEVKYSACGSDTFDLTTNIFDYIQNWTRYYEIRYFDQNGNQLSQDQWENYNPNVSGQPYMIFVYNQTSNLECSDTINFTLIKKVKPAAARLQIPVCGQARYSLADFENFVTNNAAAQYSFTDENGNALPASFDVSALPKTVNFILIDKTTGCKSDVQTAQFVVGNPSPTVSTVVDLPAKCDTNFDGIGVSFNLNDARTMISTDASAIFEYFSDAGRSVKIDPNFVNTVAGGQTIYGKVTSSGFCPVNFEIHLKINTPTKSTTLLDKYLICYGDKLTIDAGLENKNFAWSDGQAGQTATFTSAGSYTVTLMNTSGCSYTQNFVISDENQPKISQINQSETQIEIIASGGTQPYTYFFNGSPSASNILQNPTADSYEIYVQGANGCRGPSKFVYTIVIKNAITPNGDVINDTWSVKNLEKMDSPEIMISDRYGKTVFHSTDKNALVWDGTTGGRVLPTATYWYAVKWHDPATLKDEVRQGWILLKNDFSK